MPNAKAVFICNAITREGIAENLNDFLGTTDTFAPDDARLTDEICTAYAAFIGTLETDNSNDDERQSEYEWDLCKKLGVPASILGG